MSKTPQSGKAKHPHQPIVMVKGIERFKENAIVSHLLDWASSRGCDMNTLALIPFSKEDRVQFAELIGYSVCGFGDLSYVTDKAWEAATGGTTIPAPKPTPKKKGKR